MPAPPARLVGSPSDGDTNVATDVEPFYDSDLAQVPTTSTPGSASISVGGDPQFKFVSAGGSEIALAVASTHYWTLELKPQSPLQPNTRYTLTGTWVPVVDGGSVSASLAFTTGAGPVLGRPAAPKAFLQRYSWTPSQPYSTCDPSQEGVCVAFPAGEVVEVTYIDSFGQDVLPPYLYRSPYLDTGLVPTNTNYVCVRLRERAANGAFGDPTVLCARDAPLVSFAGDGQFECTSEGLTHDGQLLAIDDGGAGAGAGDSGGQDAGAGDSGGPGAGAADGGEAVASAVDSGERLVSPVDSGGSAAPAVLPDASQARQGSAAAASVRGVGCSVSGGQGAVAAPCEALFAVSMVLAAVIRIGSRRSRARNRITSAQAS